MGTKDNQLSGGNVLTHGVPLFFNRNGKQVARDAINVKRILTYDPNFKGAIAYNTFWESIVFLRDLPWKRHTDDRNGTEWTEDDDRQLWFYIREKYEIQILEKHTGMGVNQVAAENSFCAVSRYFEECGRKWDGTPRTHLALINHLGVEDNIFTRQISNLTFDALVRTVKDPGMQYDYALTLQGGQGIGKTSFLRALGRDCWYNDIRTLEGKEAIEQTRGVLVGEFGEFFAVHKSTEQLAKNYMTSRNERARLAYQTRAKVYKRTCIFFGTTNDRDFLRDIENRRFPIVECKKEFIREEFENLVDLYYGEAYHRYLENPKGKLTLGEQEKKICEAVQRKFMYTDEEEMELMEWLNTPVRSDIWECGMHIPATNIPPDKNAVKRDKVSREEIWQFLGIDGNDSQARDKRKRKGKQISRIMEKNGWEEVNTSFGKRAGKQRGFRRINIEQ